MSARALVLAAAPLAAALLALALAFLTGLDQASPLPPAVESRFYGFFLDHYPLFAFAIVYALARVLASALVPGPASALRRLLGAAVGLALVLGLALYPTFGGLVLRGGFMLGGMAFINQVPWPGAYAIGAGVAASAFGLAMGLGVVIAGQPGHRRTGGRWRRLGRGLGRLGLRYLALWFALGLLGLAGAFGFGPWPRRPLSAADTLLAALGLAVAFLPHAVLAAIRMEPRRTRPA